MAVPAADPALATGKSVNMRRGTQARNGGTLGRFMGVPGGPGARGLARLVGLVVGPAAL